VTSGDVLWSEREIRNKNSVIFVFKHFTIFSSVQNTQEGVSHNMKSNIWKKAGRKIICCRFYIAEGWVRRKFAHLLTTISEEFYSPFYVYILFYNLINFLYHPPHLKYEVWNSEVLILFHVCFSFPFVTNSNTWSLVNCRLSWKPLLVKMIKNCWKSVPHWSTVHNKFCYYQSVD
jgi:hypothetical protein